MSISKIAINGVNSVIHETGDKNSKEAIVFVHGNPGSGKDWKFLTEKLGSSCRTIAIDMPGYGEADKSKKFNYTVDGYAHHLGGIIEALGVERVHFVLHDFGGPWGLTWAAANPEKIASITLMNTGVLHDYDWHYLGQVWRTPIIGDIFMAAANRLAFGILIRHGNPKPLPKAFVDKLFGYYGKATRKAVLKLYRATSDPAGDAKRIHEKLHRCNFPVLVIWGKHDPYIPVKYAGLQRKTFQNIRVEILNDCGHWPYGNDPDRVANLIVPYLLDQYNTSSNRESADLCA